MNGHDPNDATSTEAATSRPEPRRAEARPRRLVILAEGDFARTNAKTAHGVLRYGRDPVVAVVDSTLAGRSVADVLGPRPGFARIPVVASLGEAIAVAEPPTELVIGIAPVGGKLTPAWRETVLEALRAGLDVAAGLHTFLGDDPLLVAAARASGARIVDLRRPPQRMECAVGREHGPGKRVVLTVGSDSAVGKMTAACELAAAARAAGLAAAMVPTGQTGMLVEGWGVTIDRVPADFLQGTVEWLVEQAERRADWLFVEGQGSLDHPAYSSVTLGLIHGATPQAMVLVHQLGRAYHDEFEGRPFARIKPLPELIAAHETVAALVRPARVVAVAVNSERIGDEAEARRRIEAIEAETGLPADDVYRFGGTRLFESIRPALEA